MEYPVAARSLSSAARKLQGLKGEEFKKARAKSAEARAECAKARRALRDHTSRHGC